MATHTIPMPERVLVKDRESSLLKLLAERTASSDARGQLYAHLSLAQFYLECDRIAECERECRQILSRLPVEQSMQAYDAAVKQFADSPNARQIAQRTVISTEVAVRLMLLECVARRGAEVSECAEVVPMRNFTDECCVDFEVLRQSLQYDAVAAIVNRRPDAQHLINQLTALCQPDNQPSPLGLEANACIALGYFATGDLARTAHYEQQALVCMGNYISDGGYQLEGQRKRWIPHSLLACLLRDADEKQRADNLPKIRPVGQEFNFSNPAVMAQVLAAYELLRAHHGHLAEAIVAHRQSVLASEAAASDKLLVLADAANVSSDLLIVEHAHDEESYQAALDSVRQSMRRYWNPAEWCRNRYAHAVDPGCFSSRHAKLTYEVTVSKQGVPSYRLLSSSNATPADRFYCEQAFWENSGPLPDGFTGASATVEFGGAAEKLISDPWLVGGIEPGIVTLHVVPAFAVEKGGISGFSGFNTPENLARMSAAKVDDPRLQQFREEWVAFVAEHPQKVGEKELSRKGREMREKYRDLFDCKLPSLALQPKEIQMLADVQQFRLGVFCGAFMQGAENAAALKTLYQKGLVSFHTSAQGDDATDRVLSPSQVKLCLSELAQGAYDSGVESTKSKYVFYAPTDKGRKVYYSDPSVWQFFLDVQNRIDPIALPAGAPVVEADNKNANGSRRH